MKLLKKITMLLLAFSIFSCHEPIATAPPYYEGAPKQIITIERAKEMYDNYSNRRVPIIQEYERPNSDSTVFNPTRYAEYDYETIKQYIAFIEYEAEKAEVDVKSLRFYLSNYPDAEKFPNGEVVRYPKQNTFFIVPTTNINDEEVGFFIDQEASGKSVAVSIREGLKVRSLNQGRVDSPKNEMNYAGFFTSATVGTPISLVLNDGSVIPPPPQATDFGN